MKTFNLNGTEINMVTSWEDLTMRQWIEFYKLNEKKEKEGYILDWYLLKVMEIFCDVPENGLDELSLQEYQEYLEDMKFVLETPKIETKPYIEIDEVKYGYPENFNHLTTGEYITIKTLQSRYENNLDGIPHLIAVILRPVREEKDPLTGQTSWIQEKFDTKSLQWRTDLFYDRLKAIDVIEHVGFFLSGKKESV